MNILYLTFHYKPDLGAGSFRNTALAETLKTYLNEDDKIEIITTAPHRYHSFKSGSKEFEKNGIISITRIELPEHKNGFADQIVSFYKYFQNVLKITRTKKYDLVFASSSKLFTAFLAARIANKKKIPLYLDIRDIFTDSMKDVLKNRVVKTFIIPILRTVERYTIKTASHVNFVSKGFEKYFRSYYKGPMTFYTNGIDDDFLTSEFSGSNGNVRSNGNGNGFHKKIITYAGNIGEGQGLEKVIPESAIKLQDQYEFKIIGDGGARKKLEARLSELNVSNVEIMEPMGRSALIKYYMESDYLFLHLNDYKAFEKVLPSKIFEYGATHKDIIAGVNGYAREFLEENIPDAIVFNPGDVSEFVNKLLSYKNGHKKDRKEFISKFKRNTIMNEMAKSILSLSKTRKTVKQLQH